MEEGGPSAAYALSVAVERSSGRERVLPGAEGPELISSSESDIESNCISFTEDCCEVPMSPSTLASCGAGVGATRSLCCSLFACTLSTHLALPYSLLLLFCTGRISVLW